MQSQYDTNRYNQPKKDLRPSRPAPTEDVPHYSRDQLLASLKGNLVKDREDQARKFMSQSDFFHQDQPLTTNRIKERAPHGQGSLSTSPDEIKIRRDLNATGPMMTRQQQAEGFGSPTAVTVGDNDLRNEIAQLQARLHKRVAEVKKVRGDYQRLAEKVQGTAIETDSPIERTKPLSYSQIYEQRNPGVHIGSNISPATSVFGNRSEVPDEGISPKQGAETLHRAGMIVNTTTASQRPIKVEGLNDHGKKLLEDNAKYIQEQSEKLSEMQRQVDQLKMSVTSQALQIQNLRKDKERLTKVQHETEIAYKKMIGELEQDSTAKTTRLEEELKKQAFNLIAKENEAKQRESVLGNLYSSLQKERDDLVTQQNFDNLRVSSLIQENQKLTAIIHKMKADFETTAQNTTDNWQATINDQKESYETKIQELATQNQSQIRRIQELERLLGVPEKALTEADKREAALRKENEKLTMDLKETVGKWKKEVDLLQEEKLRLLREIEDTQTRNEEKPGHLVVSEPKESDEGDLGDRQKQNEQLSEVVGQMNQEILDLRHQLEQMRAEKEDLEAKTAKWKEAMEKIMKENTQQNANWQEVMKKHKEEVDKVEFEKRNLEKALDEMRKQFTIMKKDNKEKELVEEMTSLRVEKEGAQEEVKRYQSEVQYLQNEIEAKQKVINILQENEKEQAKLVEDLQKANGEATDKVKTGEEEFECQSQRIQKLEQALEEKETLLTKAEQGLVEVSQRQDEQLTELEVEIAAKTQEILRLEDALQESTRSSNEQEQGLRDQIASLEGSVTSLGQMLKEKEEELRIVKIECEKREKFANSEENNAAKAKLLEINKEREKEVETLKKEIASYQEKVSSLEQQSNDREGELTSIMEKNSENEREIQTLKHSIENHAKKLEDTRKEKEKLEKGARSTEDKLRHQELEIKRLTEKSTKEKEEHDKFRRRNKELEGEKDNLEADLAEKTKVLETQKVLIKRFEQDLAEVKKRHAEGQERSSKALEASKNEYDKTQKTLDEVKAADLRISWEDVILIFIAMVSLISSLGSMQQTLMVLVGFVASLLGYTQFFHIPMSRKQIGRALVRLACGICATHLIRGADSDYPIAFGFCINSMVFALWSLAQRLLRKRTELASWLNGLLTALSIAALLLRIWDHPPNHFAALMEVALGGVITWGISLPTTGRKVQLKDIEFKGIFLGQTLYP